MRLAKAAVYRKKSRRSRRRSIFHREEGDVAKSPMSIKANTATTTMGAGAVENKYS